MNGKTITWSTGETDKEKARRQIPQLQARARLQRELSSDSPTLILDVENLLGDALEGCQEGCEEGCQIIEMADLGLA